MDLSELSQFWLVRWLGLYLFARISCYLLFTIYDNLRVWFLPFDLRKYGEWAVVTGSTDGIGKGLARELASKGVNVILISRSEAKLTQTAKEIESDFRVKTLYVQADFSDRNCYEHIKEKLKGLDIGILVNNVGIAASSSCIFTSYTQEELWAEIDINCGSCVMMTQMILPQMKEKKKGLIVNMSSLSSEATLPYRGTYAASKSFIKMFSLHMQEEVESHNIKILCLIPGLVKTKILNEIYSIADKHKKIHPIVASAFSPEVKEFTSYAINMLNSSCKVTSGYWGHTILRDLMRIVPMDYKMTVAKIFMNE